MSAAKEAQSVCKQPQVVNLGSQVLIPASATGPGDRDRDFPWYPWLPESHQTDFVE
jgi:hypothetical protein